MAAYVFLDINGHELHADEISATTMTLGLASSEISVEEYTAWLAGNI